MALGSLANILRASGISTMKTTKPVFQKISSSALFDVDDWTVEYNSKIEKPKVYLEFNTPPLALVLAMQEAEKESYEIYNTLQGVGKMHGRVDIVPVITTEHQKRAAEIYNYFAKKHTLRRIKDEYISKYMLAVDELCENRKKIDKENVKVLISLPRIYDQNLALERVMKGRKSAKKIETLSFAAWRGEVEFVERVLIKSAGRSEYQYYFSTPKNHLMRVVVKKGEYGSNAWDALAKFGKLYIDTEVVYTFNVRGYDFNVLQPSSEHMEIKIL
jgi:hypothetical protein